MKAVRVSRGRRGSSVQARSAIVGVSSRWAAMSAVDWWWADPAAALVISAALAAEATRVAVRHRFG